MDGVEAGLIDWDCGREGAARLPFDGAGDREDAVTESLNPPSSISDPVLGGADGTG